MKIVFTGTLAAFVPRAIVRWGCNLTTNGSFDPCVERAIDVTRILDRVYALQQGGAPR